MKQLVLCFFPNLDLSMSIISVGGMTPPVGTTGYSLPAINPEYFISYDNQGLPVLCIVKSADTTLTIVNTVGVSVATYAQEATCEGVLFGGRPVHKPR